MQKTFTVTTNYPADLSAEALERLVNWALTIEAGRAGVQGPVSSEIAEASVPRVLVTVSLGVATVSAVDGAAQVAMVDFDKEGEFLTTSDIDGLLEFDEHVGTAADIDRELASARQGLEAYLDDEPELTP